MSTTKRIDLTPEALSWRKDFLSNLSTIKPFEPQHPGAINLSMGNKKLGLTGRFFTSVFVWNLPSVATCPQASSWCLTHCYNADERETVFPVVTWAQNWWVAIKHPTVLKKNIGMVLEISEKPCAVRIHSSGDFFSIEYIELWTEIAYTFKNVNFWAYTRSWENESMLPYLEKMRALRNVQLFASWDSTMTRLPPEDWRRSFVCSDHLNPKFPWNDRKYLVCPEQIGKVENCASCGFCMRSINRDIFFYFH